MAFKKSDSDAASVHEIFQGEVVYRSPLFQRHYVWSDNELDALWADIDTILEESSSSRFLGAIVLKSYQNRSATRPQGYWIIDGQQRLTTFYLLLLGCAYYFEKLDNQDLAQDVIKAYILGQQSSIRNEPKVIPTIPDFGQFKEILSFIDNYEPKAPGDYKSQDQGNLVYAFLKHLAEIKKRISIDDNLDSTRLEELLSEISERIEFVQINLAEHHDANEVFNRLNVAGQPLEIIDLIRNEVFSLLSSDLSVAETIYTNHWVNFERSFELGKSKKEIKETNKIRNNYFFPFALIKDPTTKKAEVFNKLAKRWKKYILNMNPQDGAKSIIKDLNEYVDSYLALQIGDRLSKISDHAWERVLRLNRMPAPSTFFPYGMRLLRSFEKGESTEESVSKCLEVIESFLVRRAFLGLEPTGLHAVFKDLWKKAGSKPDEVIKNVQTRTIEFPDDERFREGILHSDLFHRRLCRYILEEFERSFTKGDIIKTFPSISIDHVMPQKRRGEWYQIISEEEHEKYLHTWANLVPLSVKANAEKSTKSWNETKNLYETEVVFSTTKHLAKEHDEWGINQIEDRAKKLADWAIKRWPR